MKSTTNNFGFYYLGQDTVFVSGEISVKNPQKIYIGNKCVISKNVEMTVNDHSNDILKCNLKFGDNSFINSASKIEAKNYVEIGRNVSIGPQVYISDMEHHYEDYRIPIKEQGMKDNLNTVIIKEGTWIGSGVKIIGNIKIGYGCVVGANSVVKLNIPDHCVVVGSPAKIIKICDYRSGQWIKINGNKEELELLLNNRGKFLGYNYYKLQNKKLVPNRNSKNKISKTYTNKDELLEMLIIKVESILDNLYEVIIKAYEDNLELVFENIVKISEEVENLFSSTMNNYIDKDSNEKNITKFNKNLKLLIEAYENNDGENFIKILEDQFVILIKEINDQLIKYRDRDISVKLSSNL